jgi:hypothetical protein
MYFRKIAGPMRVDAGSAGADLEYPLDGRPGGRACKVTQHMVKVLYKSNGNVKIGLKLKHGPDGEAYTAHTSAPSATVNSDNLMVFDGDVTKFKVSGCGRWSSSSVPQMGIGVPSKYSK